VKKALRKHSARTAKEANEVKERGETAVDFGTALNLAVMALPPRKPSAPAYAVKAHEKPLLEHITAKPLFDPRDRAMLAGYVRLLLRRIDELEPRKPGRPTRKPDRASAVEQAERYAVQLVRLKQAQWRQQYHRERVPAAETDRMIREARREAARVHKVPMWQINEANIRNALKSGRFTVR